MPPEHQTRSEAVPTDFRAETLETLRCQLGTDGSELVGRIIRLYLEQSRGLLAQIEELDATVDADRLRALAHKLKGGTATVGGDRLAAACQRIEDPRSSDREVAGATREVRGAFDALAQELAGYLRSIARLPADAGNG